MASSSATPAVDVHPAAPPPTPCNNSHSLSASYTDAALSHLIRQLSDTSLSSPPLLRFRRRAPVLPSTISPLEHQDKAILLSAAVDQGFFHLADHGIPTELATSACREGATLLGVEKEHQSTTKPAPVLGFEGDDRYACGCLVWDTTDADPLRPALSSFAREMERVGMACVEMLLAAAGLTSPFTGNNHPRCLMWVSPSSSTAGLGEERFGVRRCGRYPHAVCLRYQIAEGSEDGCLLEDDSGGAFNPPSHPDTLLVTVGDVVHVWSNERFRKVFMRPCSPNSTDRSESHTAVLTFMVTLPTDSTISVPLPTGQGGDDSNDESVEEAGGFQAKYSPFCLEE